MALVGNSFLVVIKGIAFAVSGSGAMLSEAIHSVADTANQALLLLGIKKSTKGPSRKYQYGYGADRYFYSLMSAVGIFVLGCGVTVYHGIHVLMHPGEIHVTWITWVVLAVAGAVDGFVMWKAIQSVSGEAKAAGGFLSYLSDATDPTVAAVIFEDGVAVLGVAAAAAGIGVSAATGSAIPDGIASIVIGLLLGAVAIYLGMKNRELLLGRSVPSPMEDEVIEFLESWPTVVNVKDVRSRVVGADRFRVKADLEFDGEKLGSVHIDWVEIQVKEIKDTDDARRFAAAFGSKVVEALGDEVDRIETEMQKRFPKIEWVDLETD